ncbi:MAG: hypothetical protein ACRBF0_16160 [Calditrichia bacterium]
MGTDWIAYSAYMLNFTSMSMRNIAWLRALSISANILYVFYGFTIGARPLMVGGTIAICIHGYQLYCLQRRNAARLT